LNYAILRYINSIKDKDLPHVNQLLNTAFEYLCTGFDLNVTSTNDDTYGKHDLIPLFQFEDYKNILNEKNYFGELEPGSPEYKAREVKAKDKFYEKYYQTTSESKQQTALSLKDQGNDFFRVGQYIEAIAKYDEAISIWSTKNDFFSNRGLCYFNLGNFEKAVEDYERSLELDPSVVKLYIRLGIAYTKLNKTEEAIQAYKRGLTYDPTNELLRGPLSELLKERGEELEPIPDLANLDFASLMNDPNVMERMKEFQNLTGGEGGENPMAAALQMMNNPDFRNMVQQVMASPGFGGMMQNIMANFASGGGMPPGFPGFPPGELPGGEQQ